MPTPTSLEPAVPTAPRPGSRAVSRTRGRAMRLAAVAGAAIVVLAGCQKPAPGATVWSGTHSAHAEAVCWSFDDSGSGACTDAVVQQALKGNTAPRVTFIPGSTVGISVDPVVAENGWYLAIGTQRLVSTPITGTYYRFTFPANAQMPAGGFPLEIIANAPASGARGAAAGATALPRGLWVFTLIDATTQ